MEHWEPIYRVTTLRALWSKASGIQNTGGLEYSCRLHKTHIHTHPEGSQRGERSIIWLASFAHEPSHLTSPWIASLFSLFPFYLICSAGLQLSTPSSFHICPTPALCDLCSLRAAFLNPRKSVFASLHFSFPLPLSSLVFIISCDLHNLTTHLKQVALFVCLCGFVFFLCVFVCLLSLLP